MCSSLILVFIYFTLKSTKTSYIDAQREYVCVVQLKQAKIGHLRLWIKTNERVLKGIKPIKHYEEDNTSKITKEAKQATRS
jgi:hypothetical protein